MQPTEINVIRKDYDLFMERWLAEVTFAIEGHDQPYIVMLVSDSGEEWRSNGVRFNPVSLEKNGEVAEEARVELTEDEDEDVDVDVDNVDDVNDVDVDDDDVKEENWLYTEGRPKEIETVVDLLQQRSFLVILEQALKDFK